MKYEPLVIGDLVAKVPIIQGGMGVGVSLSGLAGAVAKEGGVGVISTAQIGFKEDDYEKNPLDANLRAVKSEIIKAKKIADGNGIIGVKSPVGMPGRAIANKFMESTKNGLQPITKCYQCIKGCQAKDIPYCITKALVNSVKGNVNDGLIFCGADTWKQKKMQSVREVMRELFAY